MVATSSLQRSSSDEGQGYNSPPPAPEEVEATTSEVDESDIYESQETMGSTTNTPPPPPPGDTAPQQHEDSPTSILPSGGQITNRASHTSSHQTKAKNSIATKTTSLTEAKGEVNAIKKYYTRALEKRSACQHV